jgi:hypothetical protein
VGPPGPALKGEADGVSNTGLVGDRQGDHAPVDQTLSQTFTLAVATQSAGVAD